jgi:hypothetical protein
MSKWRAIGLFYLGKRFAPRSGQAYPGTRPLRFETPRDALDGFRFSPSTSRGSDESAADVPGLTPAEFPLSTGNGIGTAQAEPGEAAWLNGIKTRGRIERLRAAVQERIVALVWAPSAA